MRYALRGESPIERQAGSPWLLNEVSVPALDC